MSNSVILSLGTNLGDKKKNLSEAIGKIGACADVLLVSSIYKTQAWGYSSENSFYNVCVEVETNLEPQELLKNLLDLEQEMGRERVGDGYQDRLIDIDIILYSNQVVQTSNLIIPHPQIPFRRFVLEPLNEIAPNWVHPVLKKTVNELSNLCLDSSKILKID